MSFLGAPDAPDVLDPYHFPNFTLKSLERDITLLVYGISVYETILCFKAYFSICSKEKMKTPIFRFMTLAVFSMFCATLLLLLLQINKSRTDLITSTGEYTANILQCIFLVLDKIGYYIAATLRTRALLKKFPKVLYCFYSLLAISLINQIVIFGFLVDLFNKLYYSTPESFFNDLPGIVEAGLRYQNEAAFTVVFDMVFANSLAGSFLYPIFTSLDMDVLSAIKAMIKLGDVQKVLFISASSILCVAFGLVLVDPALSLAVLTVWLNTQNTQFLHLSYFSAAELLATNNKKLRSNPVSSTKAQESVQSGQAVKSAKLENV